MSVAHSCLTLCAPVDRSPPGSSVPGILQAGTLEWGAASFSRAPGASPKAGRERRGRWELPAPCMQPGERAEQPGLGRTEPAGADVIVTLGPLSQNAPKDPNPCANAQMHPPGAGDTSRSRVPPGSPSASADALGHTQTRPGRRSGTVSFLGRRTRGSSWGQPLAGHITGRRIAEEEQKPPHAASRSLVSHCLQLCFFL